MGARTETWRDPLPPRIHDLRVPRERAPRDDPDGLDDPAFEQQVAVHDLGAAPRAGPDARVRDERRRRARDEPIGLGPLIEVRCGACWNLQRRAAIQDCSLRIREMYAMRLPIALPEPKRAEEEGACE